MNNPLVSVVLPVYNGEKYLAESINCVLMQKYQPIEIIIVDDGSADATSQIAAKYSTQSRYFYQTNSGPAAARNLAIRKAKGEFIAFIDCDDLWPENKHFNQMQCFQQFPSVDIVQGLIRKIALPGKYKNDLEKRGIDYLFIYSNLGSMIMRRSIFDTIGFFNENLSFHEDTDLWLRAREADLKILIQRKEALIYRIHDTNLTTGKDIISTKFLGILRKSINRRRKASGQIREVPELSFIPDFLKQPQKGGIDHQSWKKTWPLVSVIVHGCENIKKTGKALESIYNQEYPSIQLLMVGKNVDRISVSNYIYIDQVKYIENNTTDLAILLNSALDSCIGQFVAFLDSDAEWTSGKLRTQIISLLKQTCETVCVGRTRHIIEPDKKYSSDLIDSLAFRKSIGDLLDTLVVHHLTFDKVGKFTTGKSGMVETDWLLRAGDMGIALRMLPDVLLHRYVHTDTNVIDIENLKSALLDSVHSSLKRKKCT